MGGNSSDERGVRGGVCAESPGGAKECDVVRRVEGTVAGVAVGETFKQKEQRESYIRVELLGERKSRGDGYVREIRWD